LHQQKQKKKREAVKLGKSSSDCPMAVIANHELSGWMEKAKSNGKSGLSGANGPVRLSKGHAAP